MVKSNPGALAKISCAVLINTMVCVSICCGQNPGNATALQWETSSLKFVIPPVSSDVPFVFTARNTSQTQVNIKNINPSCGCTSVKAETNEVKPGEALVIKGIIKADLGDDDKASEILVQTDDAIYRLKVTLERELPIKIIPRLVLWHLSENNEPKDMIIHMSGQQHLRLEKVDADENMLDVHVEKSSSEQEYKLVVRPKNTSTLGVYALTIHALDATNHAYDSVVYAAVRPHSPQVTHPINN